MMSSRLSAESTEFIDSWANQLKPYVASQSALIDLSVRIVKQLVVVGKLSLEPGELQRLLGTNCPQSLHVVSKRER